MQAELNLIFLGVGNASAHALGNAAAVLESADGSPLLLIDCGPTVLPAFVARYATLPSALFVTHTHLDHIGGLENLFYRLACERVDLPPTRLYVPAAIVVDLHRRLAEDPYKLAEGGVNFWDRFQLIPVGERFWHARRLFDVFAVSHHGYQRAFGIALGGRFLFTGDTRPVPEVLERFAANGELVFHDCAVHGSPSHTGVDDLPRHYPPALRRRMVLYHYESAEAGAQLRAMGYTVADGGSRFPLGSRRRPPLQRVG